MLKLFIDFDGTITQQDVGDALFERFGGERSLDAVFQYREGKLSAVDCFRRECEACGIVDKNDMDSFLDDQKIDSTFANFVRLCRKHEFPFYIVSDGMDYYIKRILENNTLGDIPFFSNTLTLSPVDGPSHVRFQPEFPYRDEVCDRCACCKRNHILTLSGDDDVIVYIGEGYSDRCSARYADVVFAKDDLLKFCQRENISYFEYQTFADIVRRLEHLLQHPNGNAIGLRKRRKANQERCDIFMGG